MYSDAAIHAWILPLLRSLTAAFLPHTLELQVREMTVAEQPGNPAIQKGCARMPEERKLVTVLFSDVVGSTSLGDSLDPEDVRALMGRYFEHARRTVAAYGGTVEKFIGDAVMAVFGLAQAHGDDAERALAAALALREAVAGDALLAGRFVLRMGVHTGEVIAAADRSSRGDFLVTGDAVNVAARLDQHA